MNYKILLLVFVLLATGSFSASAGERRFTTYYPSPSGEYRETRVKETLTIPEKEVGEDIDKVTAGEIWFEKKDDCGLRGFDGSQIVHFACEEGTPKSRFRVTTPSGKTRGIVLVDIGQSGASRFRIRYNEANGTPVIKALGHMSLGISISSCEELQMIGFHNSYPLDASYYLTQDIDCSATPPQLGSDYHWVENPAHAGSLWGKGYSAIYPNGWDGVAGTEDDNIPELALNQLGTYGFKPLGTFNVTYKDKAGKYTSTIIPFTGTFDGKHHVIKNFGFRRDGAKTPSGLFSSASQATFADIYLSGFSTFRTSSRVGTLIGECFNTNISNCHLIGNSYVVGYPAVGGLVGYAEESVFTNCSAGSKGIGGGFNGGLIGEIKKTRLVNCSSNAKLDVDTSGSNGGLVGRATDNSVLYQCTASGFVGSDYWALHGGTWGGLVGLLENSTVEECFTTGRVVLEGRHSEGFHWNAGRAGGLVGRADGNFLIKNSYSTRYVSSAGSKKAVCTQTAAGLVAFIEGSNGKIENCYASGSVDSSGNSFSSFDYGGMGGTSAQGRGGGLVGDVHDTTNARISNCFATGEVTNKWLNTKQVGGLVGAEWDASITYSNNYWYNDINKFGVGLLNAYEVFYDNAKAIGPTDQEGVPKVIDIAGITKADGHSDFYGTGSGLGKDVYRTWDFTNVWKSRSKKYPCLRWDNNC